MLQEKILQERTKWKNAEMLLEMKATITPTGFPMRAQQTIILSIKYINATCVLIKAGVNCDNYLWYGFSTYGCIMLFEYYHWQ